MEGYDRLPQEPGLIAHVQPGPRKVIFQHGLCGSAEQPAEVFPQGQGFAHAVLDARGHGASALGPAEDISLATFTSDLARLAEALRPLAVGGISMGAAMALRLAVTRPELVPALILSRPAWISSASPANNAPNREVGRLIAEGAPLTVFDASETARLLAREAPDNLASLRGFFARQPLSETATLLTRIAADGPGVSRADLAALQVPCLILGSEEDLIHPWGYAETLAGVIPGAHLVKLPPKGRDKPAHVAACRAAVLHFLKGLP